MPMSDEHVDTVILCGGRGTRLREFTEAMPKVLVEIGDKPIVWHIMKNFAAGGYNSFVLALGYKGEAVKTYFQGTSEPWRLQFAMTGDDTNTGGRIKRVEDAVRGQTFFATYGDGLSDIDLNALLQFHRRHGRIATVTAVRPRFNFGLMEITDEPESLVTKFAEKPVLDHWINGGFFVFDRRVFDYLDGDSVLETTPLETLASEGELAAYRHHGFWACMDTYKDHSELNQLWSDGSAPWLQPGPVAGGNPR
jgi:glucose-1-phosphate cytidylyltransferase